MTDNRRHPHRSNPEPPEVPADGPEAMEPAPEAAAEAAPEAADLQAEIASLKDQLLRALAETENLRRRAAREREDALKYAAAPLAKDIVAVADNLRLALASVPPEEVEGHEQLKTLIQGVELTEKELEAALERHHIHRIEPLGERLDPHLHEAMFEVPAPDKPAGTIVQVVRAGYRLRDRLLRPAQVGVAKGGPAQPRSDTAAGDGEAPGGAHGENGFDGRPGSRIDTSA